MVDQTTQPISKRYAIPTIPRRRLGAIGDLDVFDRKRLETLTFGEVIMDNAFFGGVQ
jgi:hypothetical protein